MELLLIKKWNLKSSIKMVNYIKSNYCKPGTLCGLIKTHKENNPIRVIKNGCGTATEYWSIFAKIYSYKEADK